MTGAVGRVVISLPKAVTPIVCDAWEVQRQTYSYLSILPWYQTYTAWWQLTAQDINPIAYLPEFAWPNFIPGLDSNLGR